jgi:hypothetical protein
MEYTCIEMNRYSMINLFCQQDHLIAHFYCSFVFQSIHVFQFDTLEAHAIHIIHTQLLHKKRRAISPY